MAERRMFAKSIISSARFLRMPQTARLLYYDLGMFADDDGVVEAFTVMRTTGADEADLWVLAEKGLIQILDRDELIAYITDWHKSNQLRKDRYHQSIYAHLLPNCEQAEMNGLPDGNQRLPENSQDKSTLEKSNLGNSRIEKGFGEKEGLDSSFLQLLSLYRQARANGKENEAKFYRAGIIKAKPDFDFSLLDIYDQTEKIPQAII